MILKEKPSFVFYRSFFEAIETLSNKNRLIAYEAIVKYGLDRKETTDLPLNVLAIMRMAMPNIDATHRNYYNKLGRSPQTNQKDTPILFEEECAKIVILPEEEIEINEERVSDSFDENEDDEFTE